MKYNFQSFLRIQIFCWAVIILSFPKASAEPSSNQLPGLKSHKKFISTEHIFQEEKRDKIIEHYKTKIYQEFEETVMEPVSISEGEQIVFSQPRIYKTSFFQEFETVVITAKRIISKKSKTAEEVGIVTKKDIERQPAHDLGEVLRHVPGIDVQLGGQFGQTTSLSINGSDSRQVLLMVDGIPFNTQLSGQAEPSQIPLGPIERIEVIRGASSSAWGSSLGGVVNVITKDVGKTVKPQMKLTSSFGEYSTIKDSLELSGKAGEVGYYFSGDFYKTDGQFSLTDVERKNVFAKLSVPLADNLKLTGSFGYNGAATLYGQPSSSTFSSQSYIARYGKLSLDVKNPGYKITADLKYNDQDITTDSFNVFSRVNISSTVSHNLFKGISIVGLFDVREDDQFVLGGDFDWYELKSNKFLNSSEKIGMWAPFANYTLNLGGWSLIPGVRYDHNQRFGSQTSPSLGAVYRFEDSRQSLVRAKISRAFNAPPLLWLFNDDPSLLVGPNPDLKAERGIVYELGYEAKLFKPLSMELSTYWSDIKDAIALDTGQVPYVQRNFKRFRRQGGELLLKYNLNDQWSFYGSGAFNDVKNRQTKKIVRDQGIARQRFRFGMNYHNTLGWDFNLFGYYNRWSSSPSSRPNDRKPIFDVKIIKEFKEINRDLDLQMFFNIYNLTNSSYWSSSTFPLAPRYFEGGFSLKY